MAGRLAAGSPPQGCVGLAGLPQPTDTGVTLAFRPGCSHRWARNRSRRTDPELLRGEGLRGGQGEGEREGGAGGWLRGAAGLRSGPGSLPHCSLSLAWA